jgi:DnaJ family protein C protein 19
MRKYRGGAGAVGALGKTYYKGGFEPKMTRKEATLILQLK